MATTQTVKAPKRTLHPNVQARLAKGQPGRPVAPVAPAKPEPTTLVEALNQSVENTEPKRGRGRPRKIQPYLSGQTFEKPAAPMTAKTVPAMPAAKANGNEAALLAQINELKGEIVALNAAVSKAKSKEPQSRTIEEILEGAQFGKDDWREQYHGHVLTVKAFRYSKDGVKLEDDGTTIANCLLALPRDKDFGGSGARARNSNQIALYWERSEDGERYFGAPAYVTVNELAEIWAE